MAHIWLWTASTFKLPKSKAHDHTMSLLERVQMTDRARYYPGQLSGGQSQTGLSSWMVAASLKKTPRPSFSKIQQKPARGPSSIASNITDSFGDKT